MSGRVVFTYRRFHLVDADVVSDRAPSTAPIHTFSITFWSCKNLNATHQNSLRLGNYGESGGSGSEWEMEWLAS